MSQALNNLDIPIEEENPYEEANIETEPIQEVITEVHNLLAVNVVMVVLSLIFIGITVYMLQKRDIRDEFIRRALYFLLVALSLRVICSSGPALQKANSYSSHDNVPLQQIYFEVPFYAFEVVSLAMLASWYQLFRHVKDYIEGIDHYSFERPKRYSLTDGMHESLLDTIDENTDPDSKIDKIDSLTQKLHKQFKILAIAVFVLLTSDCIVVVYKWLYTNFRQIEDENETVNNDARTDRAFYIIIDICYFTIMFLLVILQIITYIVCCVLFRRLRQLLKPDELPSDDAVLTQSQSSMKLRQLGVQSAFEQGYTTLFTNFVGLIVVLTIRTTVYFLQKFSSVAALNGWKKVQPAAFYFIFVSEIGITLLVLFLVWGSTQTFIEDDEDFERSADQKPDSFAQLTRIEDPKKETQKEI